MSQVSALFDHRSSRQPAREAPRIRVSTWHYDTIIDYLLANPGATYGEIATHLGRGQVWISMVMRSDAFQAHYASRRIVVNEAIRDSVADKIAEVAIASADLTLKHMRDNPAGIGFTQKVDTLVQASKALGFGLAPPAPAAQVNIGTNTVMLASREQIDRARERLRGLQAENESRASSGPTGRELSASSGPIGEIARASSSPLRELNHSPGERRTLPLGVAAGDPGGAVMSADSSDSHVAQASSDLLRDAPPAFTFEEATIVGSDQ